MSDLREGEQGLALDMSSYLVDCCAELMHLTSVYNPLYGPLAANLLHDVVCYTFRKLGHVVRVLEDKSSLEKLSPCI